MNTHKSKQQREFEKWFSETRCYADLKLDAEGTYDNMITFWAWKAWQASKAQSNTGATDSSKQIDAPPSTALH